MEEDAVHHDGVDPDRPYTRRAFVRGSALAVGGLVFAGVLPTPALAGSRAELDGFLDLSRLVTGTEHLSRGLAGEYLQALEHAELGLSPSRFLKLAGFTGGHGPQSLESLRRSAAYAAKGGPETAEAVAAAWWSGMVPVRGGSERVVTYEHALVWKALPYAAPPSFCLGATTAWSGPGRRLS